MINILHHGIGGGALKTVDELIEDLGDSEVANYAIDTLTQSDKTSTPKLLCALRSSNVEIQKGVMRCLRRLDANIIKNAFNSLNSKAQQIAIDGLIKALSAPDEIVQEDTANTLGYLEIKAQAAIPALVKILGESDFEVQEAAARALLKIDAKWIKHSGIGLALFELAKELIIQNSYNKKIKANILRLMNEECKLIAKNLMNLAIQAGVIFSEKEAKYAEIGLNVGLAKQDAASRKDLIKYLERSNSVAVIKTLVQTLTDVEIKKRERKEIIAKQIKDRKQQNEKRKQMRKQMQQQTKQWLPVLKPLFISWVVVMIGLQVYKIIPSSTLETADPRYQLNDDGTVVDIKTGLMWKRCSEGQTWSKGWMGEKTCVGNASYFSGIDRLRIGDRKWPIKFASYYGWRLPTVYELNTLLNCNLNATCYFYNQGNDCDENINCCENQNILNVDKVAFPNSTRLYGSVEMLSFNFNQGCRINRPLEFGAAVRLVRGMR